MKYTAMGHDTEMTPIYPKGEQPLQRKASYTRVQNYGRQLHKLPKIAKQYILLVGK